jgi:hypothetical protein
MGYPGIVKQQRQNINAPKEDAYEKLIGPISEGEAPNTSIHAPWL